MKLSFHKLILASSVAALALAAGGSTVPAPATASPTATDEPAELAFRRNGWIHVAREDGSGLRRLVRGSAPAWSPDGTRLAYANFDYLHVVRADGKGARRLNAAGRGFSPAWSPDGRRIAFVSHRSGSAELYVARADGSGVKRLTFRKRRDEEAYSPAWSPDGRWLAFSSNRPTLFNPELYLIRPDGTGLRRLTFTRGADAVLGDDGMPDWSPDSTRIAFTSNRTQDGALWTMRADGKEQRQLLNFRGTDEWYPRYSPDGRRIAFTRLFASGRQEVWLVGSDGTAARRFGAGSDPAWRPVAARNS